MEIIHWNIEVKGKVQGVYYRASTKAVADQLGLKGFVLNQSDGSVYIEVEGNLDTLDMFKSWCEEGPEKAVVETINIKTHKDLKNFKNFEIHKKRK